MVWKKLLFDVVTLGISWGWQKLRERRAKKRAQKYEEKRQHLKEEE